MTDDEWNEEEWAKEAARTERSRAGKPRAAKDDAPVTPPRDRKKKKKDDPLEPEIVGGFAFYLSLVVLFPAGSLTLALALTTWGLDSAAPTGIFIGSALLGAIAAQVLVRNHLSVLLHEFKHSVWSGFVGNKWKGLKVDRNSGHFEYAYSKQTAHHNAFISLAPYILPLFTFVGALLAFALFRHNHWLAVWLVGMAYGADLLLNMRDISPVQTDLSLIRGGYKVALSYIAAWNLALLGLVLAWVFNGVAGLLALLKAFSTFFLWLHAYLARRF
jgi:hypothetical protein